MTVPTPLLVGLYDFKSNYVVGLSQDVMVRRSFANVRRRIYVYARDLFCIDGRE